jgi:hypothetical protein
MEGDRVVVLQKNLPIQQFRYIDGRLSEDASTDDALIKRGLAHSAWSSMAYEKSLFRSGTTKPKFADASTQSKATSSD